MMRCDMCGPYTPEQAAALVLETWKPEPTGHLCESCQMAVRTMAADLAARIDADAAEYAMRMLDAKAKEGP